MILKEFDLHYSNKEEPSQPQALNLQLKSKTLPEDKELWADLAVGNRRGQDTRAPAQTNIEAVADQHLSEPVRDPQTDKTRHLPDLSLPKVARVLDPGCQVDSTLPALNTEVP
jgi:hypothetical protein